MRIRRALLAALGVVALSAAVQVAEAAGEPADYLVTLSGQHTDPLALAQRHGGQVGHVYRHALSGFAATLTRQAVAALRRDPRVRAVEPDAVVRTTARTTPPASIAPPPPATPTSRSTAPPTTAWTWTWR